MGNVAKILQLADKLNALSKEEPAKQLNLLMEAADVVGRAWSGSWLGYHSRVYYANFRPIPPGARFSIEWGLKDMLSINETSGQWVEYSFEDVVDEIKQKAKVSEIVDLRNSAKEVAEAFDDAQAELLSLLTPIIADHEQDKFLSDMVEKIEKEVVFSYNDFIEVAKPKGSQMSRDMVAIQAGLEIPPHISVLVETAAIKSPYTSCDNLSKLARRAASHVENAVKKEITSERIGTNVFIGHGRSKVWKELKDFIQDRLHLPYDEFNRVPVAGFSNIARLSEMLDSAAVAFIVLTAEDEQADGKLHARMNVIHEAGLFQGRLGFEKAILLLEEGCEEFSNVQGLGQIRFPAGDISSKFEDIRQVLEREELIE